MAGFEVNSHAHIFNFKSVFTRKSLGVLLNRLGAEKLPGFDGELKMFVLEKMKILLGPIFDSAGGELDPGSHIKGWLADLARDQGFSALMSGHGAVGDVQLRILQPDTLAGLGVEALTDLLERVWEAVSRADDVREVNLADIIGFLYTGLQPGIAETTALLMERTPPDSGVVALCMDVGGEDAEELAVIARQHRDTSAMVLHYPGRLLPFVAVNPLREEYAAIMETGLNRQGFVGVKLYPSLGFDISLGDAPTERMERICDHCQRTETPILFHCSRGGFYNRKEDIDRAAPDRWRPLLATRPGLKVCFAHFGGAENLLRRPVREDTWSGAILRLMDDHPGVYTDVAHHDAPMLSRDPGEEQRYFENLRQWLDHPVYGGRILYGTDFFMVRRVARDDSFREYFLSRLGRDYFDRIAVVNPARFLGLPDQEGRMGANLARYMDFICENHRLCRSEPADWLAAAIVRSGRPLPEFRYSKHGPRWSWNNQAHTFLYQVLCEDGQIDDCRDWAAFDRIGDMPIHSLSFYPRAPVSAITLDELLKAFAHSLDKSFRDVMDGYEPGFDPQRAMAEIKAMAAGKDARVVDLAGLVDLIYRMPQEARERRG